MFHRPLRFSLFAFILYTASAAQLPLHQTRYRMRAGEGVILDAPPETVAFVRSATVRSVTPSRFVLTVGDDGSSLLLTAPLTMPPGQYAVTVSAANADAVPIGAALTVTLDPMTPVPSSATRPPVVLLNGYQLLGGGHCQPSNTTPHSKDTFGSLETQLLADGVPVVYFFDNCVEDPNAGIEDLGNALAQVLALIKTDQGALVPQVDLVGHSMGGLIARAYLAGLQSDGSLAPPADPRVRKLILIATPNFGSFLAAQNASILGTQGAEMGTGSQFLWNLNRWNQFTDDLRGVDSVAIVGNAGPFGANLNASDGVVSLTSASLGFTRDAAHTRILPYCHTGDLTIIGCPAGGIANADDAPETAQIVRSYLSGTSAWTSIGGTPDKDPYLSKDTGVYFAVDNGRGTLLNNVSQAAWGSQMLQNLPGGAIFYNELLPAGTALFVANNDPNAACGKATLGADVWATFLCQAGTSITSVGPLVTGSGAPNGAKLVVGGGQVTITGVGLACQILCSVTANPGGITLPAEWSASAITVQLPASLTGLVQLVVQTGNSTVSITFMVAPNGTGVPVTGPFVSSVSNAASGAPGTLAPGEMITIKGTGLGPAAGVPFSLDPVTGKVDSTLAGVQVFFSNIHIPAPITYASATQINAIVPYEFNVPNMTTLQVAYQGAMSQPVSVSIATVAPGVFTFNSTGSGQAVAANQDGSFNGPSGSGAFSPAPKGSYLVVYFTGCGIPGGPLEFTADGSVTSTTAPLPSQSGIVTVGGQLADLYYAGSAPGLVSGVCQLNLRLPANIATGDALPIIISLAGDTLAGTARAVSSQRTATLAVQ